MTVSNATASSVQLTTAASFSLERELTGIVGHEAREWFKTIVEVWICSILSALGVATNVLVIAVFTRQRFRDNISISMTTIAVWDFLKCVSGVLCRLYWAMGLEDPVLGEMWLEVSAILLSYLHSFMGFVSCALAAYVSMERCLCVSMPFKVKDIFTRRLTLIMMITISILLMSSFMVIFPLWEIKQVFDLDRNASTTILAFSDFHSDFGVPVLRYYNIISVLWPLLSFIVIVVSAGVILYNLQKSSKFRGKNENMQKDGMSKRDLQVVKMLIVIIAVYIVNLFPRIAQYFARFFEPQFYLRMRYHNLFIVVITIVFIFDFVNASTNLFIFISMSTNFRNTFVEMFGGWWIVIDMKASLPN